MKIRLRYAHWLPRCLRIEGIVLYPYVLLTRPRPASEAEWRAMQVILGHEWIHVQQVRTYGWLGFYGRYLLSSLSQLVRTRSLKNAYWKNVFEVEAYARQMEPLSPEAECELGLIRIAPAQCPEKSIS